MYNVPPHHASYEIIAKAHPKFELDKVLTKCVSYVHRLLQLVPTKVQRNHNVVRTNRIDEDQEVSQAVLKEWDLTDFDADAVTLTP